MQGKLDESAKPSMIFQNFLNNLKIYLNDEKKNFVELSNKQLINWDRNIYLSRTTDINKSDFEEGKINLFQQFYINKMSERQNEIRKTLLYNCNNNSIDKIYLLNERLYSEEEMGVSSDKIIQVIINKRMMYSDVFNYVKENNITGYNIISNADIFFDKSIANIQKCHLIKDKKIYCLNRFDFNNSNLSSLDLDLSGRPDCQDVWIYHSNYNSILCNNNIFNIELGTPGCDNKIIYLFKLLGFKCYNEPEIIKTYHYHRIQTRNYDHNTPRPNYPYYAIFPALKHHYIDNSRSKKKYSNFDINEENMKVFDYIKEKITNNVKFIIPQITVPDNNLVYTGVLIGHNKQTVNFDDLKEDLKIMSNRFVNIITLKDIETYARIYLESFDKCETYIKWEPWGNTYSQITQSHYFIDENFIKDKYLWGESLFPFYNIWSNSWTLSLKDKNLLIISEYNTLIREKLDCREKIYGIDLYPNCKFEFIDLNIDDKNINYENLLKNIFTKIDSVKNNFDIALISAGGLSNLLLSYIHDIDKSGVNMNNYLETSFGIYNSNFENKHMDILALYKNEFWSKI